MTLSEIAKKAKAVLLELGIEIPVTKTETKLEDVSLVDGSMLQVEKLEVNSPATFVGADGIPVSADGTFEVADGSTIVCVSGVITEIKPKADEAAAVDTDMKATLEALTKTVNGLAAKFEAQEKGSKTIIKALETKLGKTEKGLATALELIGEVSDQAAGVSLELQEQSKGKKERKSFEKLSDEDYEALSNKDKLIYNKQHKG